MRGSITAEEHWAFVGLLRALGMVFCSVCLKVSGDRRVTAIAHGPIGQHTYIHGGVGVDPTVERRSA